MVEPVHICRNCLEKEAVYVHEKEQQSVRSKCTKWLESCETCGDAASFTSSEYASASSRSLKNVGEFSCDSPNVWYSSLMESLDKVHEAKQSGKNGAHFGNINIHKSRKIHVGNVTYITGPISFNQNVSSKKKCHTTNTVFLNEVTDKMEDFRRCDNMFVVHLNQTIHVKSKSWGKRFGDCLFKFMELCMKLVDGA